MRGRGSCLRFLLALAMPAAFIFSSVKVHAQVDSGAIYGTVKD